MTVTRTTLRAAFPEFTSSADALVDSAITRAETVVNSSTLGDAYDDAVTLYACHLLLLSPTAADLRVINAQRGLGDVYLAEYDMLCEVAGTAYRVVP